MPHGSGHGRRKKRSGRPSQTHPEISLSQAIFGSVPSSSSVDRASPPASLPLSTSAPNPTTMVSSVLDTIDLNVEDPDTHGGNGGGLVNTAPPGARTSSTPLGTPAEKQKSRKRRQSHGRNSQIRGADGRWVPKGGHIEPQPSTSNPRSSISIFSQPNANPKDSAEYSASGPWSAPLYSGLPWASVGSTMPPFRENDILMVQPGSQTTLVQYGIPESCTPPAARIPTRMFPALDPGTYTYTKIREAREGEKEDLIAQSKAAKAAAAAAEDDGDDEGDDDEGEEEEPAEKENGGKKTPPPSEGVKETQMLDEEADLEEADLHDGVYVEDEDDEEGAVWCMKEGRVVDWDCFFALLTHIYERETPGFSSPLMFIHPSTFTEQDKERVTQFAFEKLKVPGFAIYDSALASLYAYGIPTALVIDVGFEKTDITPIVNFSVEERARLTLYECGGEQMTQHLHKLLPELKAEDVEILKRSPICELLAPGVPIPGIDDAGEANENGAAKAETTTVVVGTGVKDGLIDEEEGSINVAAIVAAGKTREFLETREREKRGEAERRLPNRERLDSSFWTISKRGPDDPDPAMLLAASAVPEQPPTSPVTAEGTADTTSELRRQLRGWDTCGTRPLRDDETLREVTVGPERFRAAECGILDRIASGAHLCVSKVEDTPRRPELWENVIVVGKGSGVRGFADALVYALVQRFVIPPSTGTIFASELPTPSSGTGQSTPYGAGAAPGGGPNPLLVAATAGAAMHGGHSTHQQTPSTIKHVAEPGYFPEWKETGWEEAAFLGTQILSKVVFITDNGANHLYMNRGDYNEEGPSGIHRIFE